MDHAFLDRIFQLTPLTNYLRSAPLGDVTKSRLIRACYDRAVLLPELHDFVLRTHLRVPTDDVRVVETISQQILYDLPGEARTPGKYLPDLLHRCGQKYEEWLSNTRPPHWTWLEMAACGVTLNGWHMGVALECVFDESKLVTGSQMHCFEDRCRSSGLAELGPSAIVDRSKQHTVDKRFQRGPPRKRIKLLHLSCSDTSEGCWRCVGHIQQEANMRTQLASIEGS